ncbi:cytochrome p450 [Senna tora]|uniref:Cytochrome p450 n=1 Tax=Senna tora TaxID=362788 RepID=A0A834XBT9_9FABA|nr:cytochrome p450 [Senna tora]
MNDVNGDVNLKVSYVISNGSWDVSKLVGLASQEELNAILAIPLRSERLEDRLMLDEAKNGLYYVKLGHKFGMNLSRDVVSNKGFSPMSGYGVNKGVGNAQVNDFWVAPGTDLLKCNVDGTFHSGFKVGGVGINCRNALGEVLDGCAEKVLTCSSLLIEAWALKKALLLACLKGWERVVFESDYAVLVDAVAGLKGANVDWIHHRCRRNPSSSPSRSIIVIVKIRHHCHRDPSSSPSRSIIVVIEIRHCRCRDPSPLSLRSVTIAVDVVEHGRSGSEAQTSYG